MATGIFKTLFNVAKTRKDEVEKATAKKYASENAKQKIKAAKEALGKMNDKIRERQRELNKLEREAKEKKAKVKEWEKMALTQGKMGNQEKAEHCMGQQIQAEQEAKTANTVFKNMQKQFNDLVATRDQRKVQVSQAESSLSQLSMQDDQAKMQIQMAKDKESDNGAAFAGLGEFQSIVEERQDEAKAWEQQSGPDDMSLETMQSEIEEESQATAVKDRLAALMAANKD
jgi:phage shock protein A